MNEKTETVEKNEQTSPVRKPYAAPVLHAWGSVKDLTMAVGQSGNSDRGGRGRNTKTG
ncbi:MAG TPA: hypothetical protein VMI56_12415 [Reyranella sp.]|nr:hypothetical protein [Reyranella sp.]